MILLSSRNNLNSSSNAFVNLSHALVEAGSISIYINQWLYILKWSEKVVASMYYDLGHCCPDSCTILAMSDGILRFITCEYRQFLHFCAGA